MDQCIICHTELVNKKLLMRGRMRGADGKPMADRLLYRALCPRCGIYLRKADQGRKEGKWYATDVQDADLQHLLSDPDFSALRTKIEKELRQTDNDILREKWEEFLAVKKRGDKVFSYVQTDGGYTIRGVVLKRDQYLISQFIHQITKNES